MMRPWVFVLIGVLTAAMIGFFVGHFVVLPGSMGGSWFVGLGGSTADAQGANQLVIQYMDALRNKDFDALFQALDFHPDPESDAAIKVILRDDRYFTWSVTDFSILKTEVDGGFAKVTVRETQLKDFQDAAVSSAARKYIKTGENSVNETFYLFKDEGKWKIDPCNSGVDFDALASLLPLQRPTLMESIDQKEVAARIKDWSNTIGFGQVFALLSRSRSNVVPLAVAIVGKLAPTFVRSKAQSEYTACQSNLKSIATALEMYATDNSGRYPLSLQSLTPTYLRELPSCPAVGKDTYSAGYQSDSNPDQFTVMCTGTNHSGAGATGDMPQYTSTSGLLR